MNVFNYFQRVIIETLEETVAAGDLSGTLDASRVTAEAPRDPTHGDVATNAAMVLSKAFGMKPRDLAGVLAARLETRPEIESVEIAGPGFINLRLGDAFWHRRLAELLEAGEAYGDSDVGGGHPVNVEYVSANPTGPLHVGHGRGAVFGDALAALLTKAGYGVTKEYYVNDAGAQVDILASSLFHRYLEALGRSPGPMADELYPGDYLIAPAEALKAEHGDSLADASRAEWLPIVRSFAIRAMMDLIRDDLAAIGIHHDVFSSEHALVADGAVERAIEELERRDLIYVGVLEPPKGKLPEDWEERPQTLFRATAHGDDVDRPIRKSDGSWTYFATDIAYHLDKVRRGATDLVDVWGADHGGYVKRVSAAVSALSDGRATLDVKLCQLVRVMREGDLVRMSKRSGDFITLREVVDEVGRDVVRFIMLTRKNDAQLDFDLARVTEQSRDNPVFYVQYAHARCRSVLRNAAESLGLDEASIRAAPPLELLTDPDEVALIRRLASWPRLIESAAAAHEPHRLAFWMNDLAAAFHGFWTRGREDTRMRFILDDEPDLTRARLALVLAVASVIASGLRVFGVEPVESM